MKRQTEITTVDDACVAIKDWFGWQRDRPGPPITLPFGVPDAITTVNHRLGELWLPNTTPHGSFNIFGSQDTLIAPDRYETGLEGVIPIIWENQGVWGCGFKPETRAQLWVMGDWPIGMTYADAWRPTQDDVDTAIVFAMLANTMWASSECTMDEEDDKPTECDRLLWDFAPWDGFAGFWTNTSRTVWHMQGAGWGLTARR